LARTLTLHAPPGRERHRIIAAGARDEELCSRAGGERRAWPARLRRALERDAFVLHYQPIVSLRDADVFHHEALLRLADEPGGPVIAAAAFLPAAERHGLVGELDRMVVEKVAALLSRAPRAASRIALNVSALSITDGAMLAFIARTLRRHSVEPARLIVEVTETAAISDMGAARSFCAGVQRLGCAVALDDFGAGFGGFQYLKQLPFDYLKIDGEFVRALPRSPTDQLVVKALVAIVRGMGRRTVAEFVGDESTMRMLRAYGVDYAQGFRVGRPGARPAAPHRHFAEALSAGRAAPDPVFSAAAGTGAASPRPTRGR
jgi:EAL domain-containing protein (putative c-di-GMP-specific phosphodiesterase class I)